MNKEYLRCAWTFLVNVAAIGMGLGIYENRLDTVACASILLAAALIIAWRVGKDG